MTASAVQDGRVLRLNYSKLRLLILEEGSHILDFCRAINIPVTGHETTHDESIAKDISAGVYNCIIVDGADDNDICMNILASVAGKPPFLPVIVIDGSLGFLRRGASECILRSDLTAERLETALFNADRLCKLNNRTTILEMELSAFIEEDPLTALPGRSKFRMRMAKAIEKAHAAKIPASLIILDINSFRELNEIRGHEFGDEILKRVAKRLINIAPDNSIIGRLGDDEFALLALDQETADPVGGYASRLLLEIRRPYLIDGQKPISAFPWVSASCMIMTPPTACCTKLSPPSIPPSATRHQLFSIPMRMIMRGGGSFAWRRICRRPSNITSCC